jgi:hypothetical protein
MDSTEILRAVGSLFIRCPGFGLEVSKELSEVGIVGVQ